MKTRIYLLSLALGTAALATSCDILDQSPADYVSDEGVINNESTAQAALNGAYHQLGGYYYYGGVYFVAGIELASDNVTWTGSLNFYYDFNTHNYSSENQLVAYSWDAIYATVNQANQVIDKTKELDNVTDTEKSRIVAEATVIRSLAFFDLARTWGNVCLVREATSSPTQFDGVKQTEQTQVYKEVIEDVLDVYSDLNATSARDRINQSTADALLARVYLYLEDWDNAERYAGKLIGDSRYELVDYSTWIQNKLSNESIWELSYSTANTNGHSAYWLSPNDGGRHEWGPSKELVQLLADPNVGGTRSVLYTDLSTAQVPDYYVGNLYYRSTSDDPAFLFRIAEQYLIRAEARAKKSSPDIQGALADLNAVRRRAQVPDYTSANQDDVIQAIEDERRVELALEPHRWFDLTRTHRATTVLGIKEYQTLFPIPYNDIQADKDLVQNTGY
jgi:hypothetical protein